MVILILILKLTLIHVLIPILILIQTNINSKHFLKLLAVPGIVLSDLPILDYLSLLDAL